jgi:hypothetical protein
MRNDWEFEPNQIDCEMGVSLGTSTFGTLDVRFWEANCFVYTQASTGTPDRDHQKKKSSGQDKASYPTAGGEG